MHWPFPPNPAEYQSPGLGLVVTMFAIVLIFLVLVFYAAKSSGPWPHESESPADETRREEIDRQNMTN